MIIRDFKEEDLGEVLEVIADYWSDSEFLKRLTKRLYIFIDKTDEAVGDTYRFFVAEEDGKVVGIAGMRKASDYMKSFTKTKNPCEFYVSAVKEGYKRKGIGNALRVKRFEEAHKLGFTEIVLFSPDSHKEFWRFHDRHGFKRVGQAKAPDGEEGMVWCKKL